MPSLYPSERNATRRIREANPDLPQRTLAYRVACFDRLLVERSGGAITEDDLRLLSSVPEATTYSRIRRIDEVQRARDAHAAVA